MHTALRHAVLEANTALFARGLALFTFGNASAIDRATGQVIIKPSGVAYHDLKPEELVVTDLAGTIIAGSLRPSSDLATHLALYRAFPEIGGVVHTHSHFATTFAQAQREIPCLGTTHADYFRGAIPVTAALEHGVIQGEYEAGTGEAIIRCMVGRDPLQMRAALVASHAPFCWAGSVSEAVEVASLLEEVAKLAWHTLALKHAAAEIDPVLLDRHYLRKHGAERYYGQK